MNTHKQDYTNLSDWCEHYNEASGIKVHASSVPVDAVLDDILGRYQGIMTHLLKITDVLQMAATKYQSLEKRMFELEKLVLEQREALEKNTKTTKQVKCTNTKEDK